MIHEGALMQIKQIVDAYGPYAFGIIAVVTLWLLIVRPELKANRASTKELLTAMQLGKDTANILKQTAGLVSGIVETQNALVKSLRDSVSRLEELRRKRENRYDDSRNANP